jgi:thermolysin
MKKKCVALGLAVGLMWIVAPAGGRAAAREGRTSADALAVRARSRPVLAALAARHGLTSEADLRETRLAVDGLGMAHRRLQQTHGGVPVLGGEVIVHLGPDGAVRRVTDDLLPRVQAETTPRLAAREAERRAIQAYGCAACLTGPARADLFVYRAGDRDRLVWFVRLARLDGSDRTAMPVFFVDAGTGETLFRYDDLQTVAGTGHSLYRGIVPMDTFFKSDRAGYFAEDVGRGIGTFDSRNGTSRFISYRLKDADNVWDAPAQRAAADVHWAAARMWDYLRDVHGRDGLDGLGGPGTLKSKDGATRLFVSRVHYGTAYNNAFFAGVNLSFGDGDGTLFSPLVPLDVVGHEMQHGVTLFSGALFYFNEPGALNESWSDVFGTLLERHVDPAGWNWRIGEDCFTPANGDVDALRHMDDPHAADDRGLTADDDPDHYSERYTGTADNGGVHLNSGIPNKAFYLLAEGGTHHLGGSMTGIGPDKAGAIWYRAVTTYMTVLTNFARARTATLNAAADLYGAGSDEQSAVCQAWQLVGVGATCD